MADPILTVDVRSRSEGPAEYALASLSGADVREATRNAVGGAL